MNNSHLHEMSGIGKSIETERSVVVRGWGEKGQWRMLVGTEFLYGKIKNVLEIDSNNGCTTLLIY